MNLTAALGYGPFNLYGISYGTYLAQRIMANHPDRVRSAVLDSTVPVQANKYEAIVRDIEVSFLNLVEDCEADATCGAAYPNLTERTVALLNQLDQAPLPLAEPITPLRPLATPIERVSAAEFATLITLMNNYPGQIAPYVPLIVQELEQGITTTFAGVITGALSSSEANSQTFEASPETYRLQARDFEAKAEDILRARATAAGTSRPASRWVQQIQAVANTLPESEGVLLLVNFLGVGYTETPRNRETLIAFVAEEFESDTAATLSKAVQAMSGVEVRHVDVVSALTDSFSGVDAGITTGMFRSLDCRELVPFSDPAQTEANYETMLLPQLGSGRVNAAQQAYNLCSFWPVEAAPASEHAPINSTIPTLVLQGRYDVQTNTEMGIGVMEGLRNGTFVEFSSTGHGAIVASQCAKDIGVAFVNDPDRTPDSSCTTELFPEFVLAPAE